MNYESISNCICVVLKTLVEYQQRDQVMKFLMGLNESYKTSKAHMLLINLFPSLREIYSIVQQEETCME